jgi:hypothetical protein
MPVVLIVDSRGLGLGRSLLDRLHVFSVNLYFVTRGAP